MQGRDLAADVEERRRQHLAVLDDLHPPVLLDDEEAVVALRLNHRKRRIDGGDERLEPDLGLGERAVARHPERGHDRQRAGKPLELHLLTPPVSVQSTTTPFSEGTRSIGSERRVGDVSWPRTAP